MIVTPQAPGVFNISWAQLTYKSVDSEDVLVCGVRRNWGLCGVRRKWGLFGDEEELGVMWGEEEVGVMWG